MWINSPLGKWEQETRMDKALRDAERTRAQEEGHDTGSRAGFGSLLHAAGDRMHWLAARTRSGVAVIQTWLAVPATPQD